MAITITVLTTNDTNVTGFIGNARHGHIVPHGSSSFDLNDSSHHIVFHASGSGFRYGGGFLTGGAINEFVIAQNSISVLDVTLAPSLKALTLANASGFASYFQKSPYVFHGNDGNDSFKSGWGRDHLDGGKGNDTLNGNIGNDHINGGEGNDTLIGNRGNDVLIGGLGMDSLSGGKNTDHFVFNDVAESVVGANRDVIINFHHDQHDHIDLVGIDADTTQPNDQAFHFIGSGAFGSVAGELRFAGGVIQGDVDGNGVADFEIALLNVTSLVQSDFIL